MVELAGGRWPAKAAAAVTQLPFRVSDCQWRVSGTVAVRRAQRHRWDVAVKGTEPDGRTGGWVMGCQRRGGTKTTEIMTKENVLLQSTTAKELVL